MILEGTVEEIVYRNEDNGYTVAVIEHNEEYSTIVGRLISINVGESIRVVGEYTTNSKYGEQFSFTSSEIIFPSTASAIEKYLSSGLVRGVGPVTANAIVKEFGDSTLEVIECYPEKLEKVKGISQNKAQEISGIIGKLKNLQNTMMFLQNYNISTNMALKIFDAYAEKTVETVKNNPYQLVEDVEGIGFQTADKIAMSLGVKKASPFRIRAGVLYVLQEASDKVGHTYLLEDRLFDNVIQELGLGEDIKETFDSVLTNLVFDKVVSRFKSKGQLVVMLAKFHFAENLIAQKLAMLNATAKKDNFDISNEIKAYELVNNLKLHEEQKSAIDSAVNNGVAIITGGPGTGKTTIVKCIIGILEQNKKKVLLVAPTGRASKRLNETTNHEAKTIHRALELDFKSDKKFFKYNETNPLNYDAVIVDEVSMVDVMLMSSLMRALPRDCKLVLVGDKDQLPSVGAGNVLDDIIKSDVIKVCYLTQIFRQEENSLIISNAHKINNGEMPVLDNSSADFFFEKQMEPIDVKNSVVELVTKRIPNFTKLESDRIQVLAPLKAGVAGVENLNTCLQEKMNPQSALKKEVYVGKTIFREGDKIMQMVNNYDLVWEKPNKYGRETGEGVFNGDIGFIHKINRQTGEVTIWFDDGRECVYPRTELIQLSLAYAITIHKSQGSEFDVVIIPLVSGAPMIMTRNLIYTAVTRAKKIVMLVGDKRVLARMIHNTHTIERHTMLKQFLIENDKKVSLLFS